MLTKKGKPESLPKMHTEIDAVVNGRLMPKVTEHLIEITEVSSMPSARGSLRYNKTQSDFLASVSSLNTTA